MAVKFIRHFSQAAQFPSVEKPVASGVTVGDGDFVKLSSGNVTNPGATGIFGRVAGGPNDNLVSRNYRAPLSTGDASGNRKVLVEIAEGEEFEIDVNGQLASDAEGKYYNLANGGGVASVLLTSDATAPSNNDTVTVGGVVYIFKTTLTGAANEVLIGANAAAALTNLKAAINNSGGAGSTYGTGTVANTVVQGSTLTATTLLIVAVDATVSGRAIAATETSTHLSFDVATLYGGPTDQVVDNLSKSATAGQFLCVRRVADKSGNFTKGRFVVSGPQTIATAF